MGSPGCYWKSSDPDGFCIKHERDADMSPETDHHMYGFNENSLNFSTGVIEDDEFGLHKRKIVRDPMSHRIIEKRRRDRMNNCLADLSRLIPADYLKKGRGRIEKTEIIEMAIKHMRHLQNSLTAARTSTGETSTDRDEKPQLQQQQQQHGRREPIVTEHYRLGYLECLSEAMHFLVEIQGFFAGDTLCVQMMNHLHKHCDKLLKGDVLNFPRKHSGETTSNSSTSTTNGNYNTTGSNNSPPLGMSNSTGSNSNDHINMSSTYPNESYEKYQHSQQQEFSFCNSVIQLTHDHSSVGGSTGSGAGDNDRDVARRFTEDTKISNNYSTSSGFVSTVERTTSMDDDLTVSDTSQLREMLITRNNLQDTRIKSSTDVKTLSPALSQTSGCDSASYITSSNGEMSLTINKINNTDSEPHIDHAQMYKFKNNIKQRFTKEIDDFQSKKLKINDNSLKFNNGIYLADSKFGLSNRLGFGHKKREIKKMEEVAVFALHSSKSFYVPLSLQANLLTSFGSLLGLSDNNDDDDDDIKPVLHPVTISVKFQPNFIMSNVEEDHSQTWRLSADGEP